MQRKKQGERGAFFPHRTRAHCRSGRRPPFLSEIHIPAPFQHICYAHPELTPKERTYQWHLLEEKYMPWRRYEDDAFMERGGYWYHKLHIYLYPFYYINYTLTTMGAMEFKKKYAENKEAAWQDYLRLCRTGGSRSYLETLRYANLTDPFEEGSVQRACGYAEEILLRQIAAQEK